MTPMRLPNALPSPARTPETTVTPGTFFSAFAGATADGGEVVGRRQRVVALEHRVDGVLERRLQSGGEHGDERDEREPDHERGRGRRGPLTGFASRCPRASSPGAPPKRAAGQPSDARERRDEHLREQRDAEEHRGGPDADGEQALRRRERADEEADEHERDRAADDRESDGRDRRAGEQRLEDGALAHGGDRRRRASPGTPARAPRASSRRSRRRARRRSSASRTPCRPAAGRCRGRRRAR